MCSTYSSLETPWSTSYSSKLNFFRYLLLWRRYKWKSVEVDVFLKEVGHFERKFQTDGGVAHQLLLVLEN